MQEVIIYRNPIEAAMWQMLSSPEGLAIFLVVMGAAAIGVVCYAQLESRCYRLPLVFNHRGKISIAVTIALLYGAHHFFFA